jgi:L-asparaginase II
MDQYLPLVELTRGPLVESIHFGAMAVCDPQGRLLACVGDPDQFINLRSSAKPFQILSFVEDGGPVHFGMSEREVAITCASHGGTDDHVAVLAGLQAKLGVSEANLSCGVHYPLYEAKAREMRARGETPTPNRHNCSGKHTGMLANALLHGFSIENYLDTAHPLQQLILKTFGEMMELAPEEVLVGIDGCSAPTFAAPLRSAARAFARLADPSGLPERRAAALRQIYQAMTSHPDMVGGPDFWDTAVMSVTRGRVLSKSGAEGYQAMAVRAGALGEGSPALGITLKISDGDQGDRARSTAAFAALDQLGLLDAGEKAELARFDRHALYNWRKLEVGEIRAAFHLERLAPR